jgi:hypothetical protein
VTWCVWLGLAHPTPFLAVCQFWDWFPASVGEEEDTLARATAGLVVIHGGVDGGDGDAKPRRFRPPTALARRIGLPISNDTLLRWVKRCAQPTTADARVIDIDEWVKRKGRTYGTIVVDLERHTVIDVLDQHSTEAVEQAAHPEIQICRDRNGRYAKAARTAPPAVRQVTGRSSRRIGRREDNRALDETLRSSL